MIRNVFGDFQITGKDYAIIILRELILSQFISISPNLKTDKGVNSDRYINVAGFYFIYNNGELVYIGYTNHSIHGRIGNRIRHNTFSILLGDLFNCISQFPRIFNFIKCSNRMHFIIFHLNSTLTIISVRQATVLISTSATNACLY